MKFNWGVGITIFIIAFITFILSFVFRAAQTDTDLTSEDYYEQEINYQQTIDAKNNAVGLKDHFKYTQSEEFFVIEFPEEVASYDGGKVHFYRPENADKDKTYSLEIQNGIMAFPKTSLLAGGYHLKVSWTKSGKDYLVEQTINIE
jgi:hypothetical protein